MTAIQHVLPDGSYLSEVAAISHVTPGGGYVKETVAAAPTGRPRVGIVGRLAPRPGARVSAVVLVAARVWWLGRRNPVVSRRKLWLRLLGG